MMEEEFVV